ncbi:MAG: tetratricopeptide repeat protein [Lentisphaeria bacterium]|nr:tetratricopeptide repeat protein [Lentisphaeria bacterium]
MAEKTLKDVSKRCRDLYTRGTKAFTSKNYGYAVEMFRETLKIEPTLTEVRQKLRDAQLKATNNGKLGAVAKLMSGFAISKALGQGKKAIKAQATNEALDAAEQAISSDPSNLKGANFLVKVARAIKDEHIELSGLQLTKRFSANKISSLKELAEAYKKCNQLDQYLETWHFICDSNKANTELQSELKAAIAFVAMNKGNWEKAESFRDIIADKDKQEELEIQEQTAIRDVDTLNKVIASTEQAMEEEETTAGRKRLAELYSQAENWTQARDNFKRLTELTGVVEPTIAAAIAETAGYVFDEEIEVATDQATKDRLTTEKNDMLFEHATTMVKRFPNDPSNRFELGVALFNREDYTTALSELQQSQRNPRFKAKAGRLMGQCFHKRGQIDMAIDQFNAVLAELPVMNEDKKETLYCLATALTDQGKGEEGVKIFKEIFQADVSFKDIDARINAFYDSQNA